MGQLQIALDLLLLERLLVQLGVFQREGRLAGHAGQHVEIVLLETAALVERVDLDRAKRFAVAIDQRGAHHRADAKIGDALAHFEPRVAGGVGRQDRLLVRHHLR